MRHRRAIQEKSAVEIIEEAFHLLRTAPPGALVGYAVGTIPFALGFLFFWADMSRGAFGHERCVGAALMLALAYLWMKAWHAVFAANLMAQVAGSPAPVWGVGRVARLAILQTISHPYIFLVLPVAALMTIPFGWMYAFFFNLTCLGDGEDDDLRKLIRRSWMQAALWPRQNHLLIVIFVFLGIIVFINVAIVLFLVPHLFKMFSGIESAFTLSGHHVLNTTFFATACILTYLCMNPLIHAVYGLRCFYGESLQSGADLKADLTRIEKEQE
jgi:hypothetical protein